jgi:hypothetical protein
MPVHDWTRVSAGTFHDFHNGWITHLKEELNNGILPRGYYAQSEQSATGMKPDVLTLATPMGRGDRQSGGVAVAESEPRVAKRRKADPNSVYRNARRTLVIRHASGHQIIALVEIASRANKDREQSVAEFVEKLQRSVSAGIHVVLVDLFPPGPYDPLGLHGEFWQFYDLETVPPALDHPLCLASYEAADLPDAWIQPLAVGELLSDMPLFFEVGRYVNLPLEKTYHQAYRGVPEIWRDVIEGRSPSPE